MELILRLPRDSQIRKTMLNAGQPGFVHAPVTKVIVGLVVFSTIFSSIVASRRRMTLDAQSLKEALQPWRFFTHQILFMTPGELLFGVVLLYSFRQQERVIGSSRFAAFVLVSCMMYTILLSSALLLYPSSQSLPSPAPGPYAIIFACLLHFAFETPRIYHFQLFGFAHLSDKALTYFILFQFLLSHRPHSYISSVFALAVGLIMRLPPFNQLPDFPQPMVEFFSNCVLPYVASPPPAPHPRRRSRHATNPVIISHGNTSDRNAGNADNGNLNDSAAETADITSAHVDTLVSMGFSQNDAVRALRRTQDDLQVATELLLRNSDNNEST